MGPEDTDVTGRTSTYKTPAVFLSAISSSIYLQENLFGRGSPLNVHNEDFADVVFVLLVAYLVIRTDESHASHAGERRQRFFHDDGTDDDDDGRRHGWGWAKPHDEHASTNDDGGRWQRSLEDDDDDDDDGRRGRGRHGGPRRSDVRTSTLADPPVHKPCPRRPPRKAGNVCLSRSRTLQG